MTISNKNKATRVLQRLEKYGETTWDGITPGTPAGVIDTYRAQEDSEFHLRHGKHYQDNVELSRRLMNIDNDYYHVSDEAAYKLLDYIEQNDFDVVDELNVEINKERKKFNAMKQELVGLDKKIFLSQEDYQRSMAYKIKQLRIFEKKMQYIRYIIQTINEFNEEIKNREYEAIEDTPSSWAMVQTRGVNNSAGIGR